MGLNLQLCCSRLWPELAPCSCLHAAPCAAAMGDQPAQSSLLQEFEAAGFEIYGMSFDKPKSQVRLAL